MLGVISKTALGMGKFRDRDVSSFSTVVQLDLNLVCRVRELGSLLTAISIAEKIH